MAGLWCTNIGYGRQEMAEVAYKQMLQNSYTPLTYGHTPAISLSQKISELLGDDYVVFYSNSGSEANEVAFKIVRQYHQQKGNQDRYKIISRYRAYHGNTMGALAATGQAQRKYKYEPLASGFLHVAPPDQYRNPEQMQNNEPTSLPSVKNLDQTMTWEMSETIAAFIMEPIITGGGVIVPNESYLKGVKEVCEKHGALLIIDEVICGFGRTGKAFGFQNYGVKPDIVTMAIAACCSSIEAVISCAIAAFFSLTCEMRSTESIICTFDSFNSITVVDTSSIASIICCTACSISLKECSV